MMENSKESTCSTSDWKLSPFDVRLTRKTGSSLGRQKGLTAHVNDWTLDHFDSPPGGDASGALSTAKERRTSPHRLTVKEA
jgi:hypothetical protein